MIDEKVLVKHISYAEEKILKWLLQWKTLLNIVFLRKLRFKNYYTNVQLSMSILPFLLGLEGWEKRLIISDRAHIGKGDIVHLYITMFLSETYESV